MRRTKMTHTSLDLRFDNAKFETDEFGLTIKAKYSKISIFAKDKQLKELHKELGKYLEDRDND